MDAIHIYSERSSKVIDDFISCANLLKKAIAFGTFGGYVRVQKYNASEVKMHLVLGEINCKVKSKHQDKKNAV